MAVINTTNITAPRVPIIDVKTGLISREWYRFFLNLFVLTGSGQNNTSLTDLQIGPPGVQVDEITDNVNKLTENVTPSNEAMLSQIAELQKQVQGLQLTTHYELGTMSALQQANLPWVTFDNTPQSIPTNVPGTMYWDEADGNQTLNLVMAGGLTTQQIGEEQYYRIKADSTITEGQVIMFTGTVGASGALKGAPATGLTAATALYVMGVATENITVNGWGYVTSFGLVRGINTTGGAEAWVDGQILYLNPAVPGGLTKNVPVAPNPKVVVAAVVYAATNGSLFIRPAFGGKLGDFEGDVNVSSPVNGDLLIYDAVQGRWENATLTAGTNVSITNGAGSITINSSNPGGTVTSVGLSAPTGFSVSGSPVTSSGTLALSFAAGYSLPTNASQTNWNTAYSERNQWDGGSTGLTASTGRTSLGATTVGSNLFTLTNPSAIRFLRVNADNTVSALDAATFRTAIGAGTSSTTGTVTSIDVSGGTTGLTTSGGPVTSSGTITLAGTLVVRNGGTGRTSLTAGYVYYGAGTSAMSQSNMYTDGTNVGINNTSPTAYGGRLVLGNYSVTSATSENLYIATTRAIAQLWADGANNAAGVKLAVGWANGGQGPFSVLIGASTVGVFDTASVRPGADNTYSSGTAGNRWSVVYAATGTINTSDISTKEQIQDLSAVELRVAMRLKCLIKRFKFKDAVVSKGQNARVHVGWIAQEVEQSFKDEGLDASSYALFCRDEWWEKTVQEEQDYLEQSETGETVRKTRTVPVLKTFVEETQGAMKKSRLGVRHDQLLAFIVAAL